MDLLAGRYRLGAPLGSGGMARVYEATDEVLGRRVAIKVLPAEGAEEELRSRFVREAGTAASFAHPNVVGVYDAGDDGGTLFLAMELIEGSTLVTVLAERAPLDEAEAVGIAEQVLDALDAAHAAGVVHRDVKPGNILVSGEGTVKLVDFGIAKAVSDIETVLTGKDAIVGTVRYMSPEQTMGEAATPESDLYAVGVMLYEMLAGSPPFTGDTTTSVALAHQQRPVPSIRESRPEISEAVDLVIRRALAKDPKDRPGTAAEMRRALRLAAPTRTLVMPAPGADPTLRQPRPQGGEEIPAAAPPPSRPRSPSPARPGRLGWLVAGLAAGAIVTAALLRVEGPSTALPLDDETGLTTTEATTTTAPEEIGDALDAAETIGHLTDILAPDPRAYGPRGMDLLEGLHDVQERMSRNPRDKARDLLEKIEDWLEKGQIDERMARRVVEIVGPLAR